MGSDSQVKPPSRSTLRIPQRALGMALAAVVGSVVGGVMWTTGMQAAGGQSEPTTTIGAVIALASALLGLNAIYRIVSNLDDMAVRIYELTDGLDEQRSATEPTTGARDLT
jgi:hypothetical protein